MSTLDRNPAYQLVPQKVSSDLFNISKPSASSTSLSLKKLISKQWYEKWTKTGAQEWKFRGRVHRFQFFALNHSGCSGLIRI
jgi:hypothetical protein